MAEKCNAKECGVLANNGFYCKKRDGKFICFKCCRDRGCESYNAVTQLCDYEVGK